MVADNPVSNNSEREEVRLPKRTYGIEFMVGLFAIVGLAAFAYLSVNIGGMRFGNSGYYTVLAEFDSVSGLQVGAPVEIAGVQVGHIDTVQLKDTVALVKMQIKNGVVIRDDDIAAIRTKGIIGDRYIKISPGGSKSHLKEGEQLTDTESAVEFEEVLGKFIHSME